MQKTISEEEREKYLSIGEAAEYLDISVDTLRRWEKKDRVTAYRSEGGHRYFDEEDLEKLVGKRYTRTVENETRNREKKGGKEDELELEEKIYEEEKEESVVIDNEREKEVEKVIVQAQEIEHIKRKVIIPPNVPVRIRHNPLTMRDLSTKVSFSTFASVGVNETNSQSILDPILNAKKKENKKQKPKKALPISKKGAKKIKKKNKTNKKKVKKNNKAEKGLLAKMKSWSKMQKIAVSAVAVFVFIDIILFFIWYSIPKLLSPIP